MLPVMSTSLRIWSLQHSSFSVILKVHWRSNSKNLASENRMNGIVCSAYFLSSCLAQKRCANLIIIIIKFIECRTQSYRGAEAVGSCAFLFLKCCSFKSRLTFEDPMRCRIGNSSLLCNLTNGFVSARCTFLTWHQLLNWINVVRNARRALVSTARLASCAIHSISFMASQTTQTSFCL